MFSAAIGLGDMVPSTRASVVFQGFYCYVALGLFAYVLSALGDTIRIVNRRSGVAVAKAAQRVGFSTKGLIIRGADGTRSGSSRARPPHATRTATRVDPPRRNRR